MRYKNSFPVKIDKMRDEKKLNVFDLRKGNGHKIQSITIQGNFIYVLEEGSEGMKEASCDVTS